MEQQFAAIPQRIEVGFHAFLSGGDQAFGAVRGLPDGDLQELVVYVENAGEFLVPQDAIETVVSQKVIFNGEKLAPELRQAIDRAHDAEDDEDVSTPEPARLRTDPPRAVGQTGTVDGKREQRAARDPQRPEARSNTGLFAAATGPLAQRVRSKLLRAFGHRRERIRQAVWNLPKRFQRVTNQARLATELVDDFQAGAYRGVAWRSIALLAGALVYSVNPADAIPDALPALGTLDDLFVMSLALKLVRRELERYCAFKGYDPSEYFG